MKTFSDLLATDHFLSVTINQQHHSLGLHDHLDFDASDQVTVDGIEVLPRYQYLAVNGRLTILVPFYQWYHEVSGQGWLLKPQ